VPFEALDELIRRQMEADGLPGLAIALVRGGETVWSRGYGVADLGTNEPVTPQSVFSIQSVTKPVVTTALMQHYARGAFDLDAPVNGYLSGIQVQNAWEAERPVTIRNLLTHTSGLPVDGTLIPPGSEPQPLEEFLAAMLKTERAPGGAMIYANYGYDLTGYLAGRFAETSYDVYLRDSLLAPLGMRSTYVELPEGASMVNGYYRSAYDGQLYAPGYLEWGTRPSRPCGCLLSTVEDLGHFLGAHLSGGVYEGQRVLKQETVADMHRVHAALAPLCGGMGLGFRVTPSNGRTLVCHGGDGTTFTDFIGMYPDERAGVALLINMGRAQSARSVIANAALRALLGEPLVAEAPRAKGEDWPRFSGRYASSFWGIDSVLTVDGGAPAVSFEGAFSWRDEGEVSRLYREGGVVRAIDGPFAGFDLSFSAPPGAPPSFFGGLYPFRFDRVADVPRPPGPVDESADLAGAWRGTVRSPLGPVPVSLVIGGGSVAVSALSAHDAPLEELAIGRGRLTGRFDASVPGLGDFRVFLRLVAVDGKLAGKAYARYAFGEVPMPVELERTA